jgi:hypothetical protein
VEYQDEIDARSSYDEPGGSQRGEVRFGEAAVRRRGKPLKYVSEKLWPRP